MHGVPIPTQTAEQNDLAESQFGSMWRGPGIDWLEIPKSDHMILPDR